MILLYPLPLYSSSPLHSRSNFHSPLSNSRNIQYNDTIAFRKFLAKSVITLLKRTANFDTRLKRIEKEVSNSTRSNSIISESEDEESTLPLKDVEQLQEFETMLHDKETFKKMIERFKCCKNKKVTTVTNAVLRKLITDELAMEYSWQGRKGKKSINKLSRLSQFIKKVVRVNCASCTDSKIESAAGYWFAQAKSRIQRQKGAATPAITTGLDK
ncbi:hypothetical protein ABEB36_014421 [Hypothenemus hampei]|uniref:DUF4806 domain-containing protein n=1 Tax=Hypothenemus hampei TaxID=57062 RepID=A0ABD1E1Q3_HYPHA